MALYFKNFSTAGKVLFPSLLWNLPSPGNKIYLTFDDGPIPEVTPWVLSLLKEFDAKATFFCIGDNIEKHPAVFQKILTEGHRVGNHSYNHLNGWKTPSNDYVKNVLKAEECISENWPTVVKREERKEQREENREQREENKEQRGENREQRGETGKRGFSKLFRPPYGRIKPSQVKKLKKLNYEIVMWDIISGDFDKNLAPPQCLDLVKKFSKPGSIVVFHDSLKAEKNLREVLPEVLEFYKKKGYSLESF